MTRVSPLTGQAYDPVIQTDYASVDALSEELAKRAVHTVLSAVSLDFDSPSEAQLKLIRAAAKTDCVKRFVPSEFNVDYDLGDDKLPYPDKKYHAVARRELEKTSLEYTYIYSGFFMDYFGMPFFQTHMRQLYILVDAGNRAAAIPGDGNAPVAMTCTKDVARFVAAAIELRAWPKELKIVGSQISTNELVTLIQQISGEKLNIKRDSIEDLLAHKATVLPGNNAVAQHFPEGLAQLQALVSDLSASIALGAYDLSSIGPSADLVKLLGELEPPTVIEDFIAATWKRR